MVRTYKDKELLEKVKSLSSFKDIPSGYWLLGVRSNEDTPNRFDDKIYLFKGEEFILVTSATTNLERLRLNNLRRLTRQEQQYSKQTYGIIIYGSMESTMAKSKPCYSSEIQCRYIETRTKTTSQKSKESFRRVISESISTPIHTTSQRITQELPSDGTQPVAK